MHKEKDLEKVKIYKGRYGETIFVDPEAAVVADRQLGQKGKTPPTVNIDRHGKVS